MIKTEMGMVKAKGSKAVLLTDLTMIITALCQEFSEEEIQESVNRGFNIHKEDKEQEDDGEKRSQMIDEIKSRKHQIIDDILTEIFGPDVEQ